MHMGRLAVAPTRETMTMNITRPASISAVIVMLFVPAIFTAASAQERPAALAPILVEPYDGKDVVEEQIVWSWFMQSKTADGREVLCDLVVVEILEGQTPEEAMRLNPPLILRENLTTSSWQTPPIARSLQHGRRYAWQITAKVAADRGGLVVISQSELWEFTFNDPAVVPLEIAAESASVPATDPPPVADSAGVTINDTLLPTGTGEPEPDAAVIDEAPRPIRLSGEARHTLASENRRGNLSAAPVRFDRIQIEPTITLFDVPLDLSLLVTTEQNLRQSDLSRGAFGTKDVRRGMNLALQQRVGQEIDALERQQDSASIDSLRAFVTSDSASIAERIARLRAIEDDQSVDESMEALQQLNLLTPEQRTIARFPSFGFGQVAPNFGSLLFDRVTISGGALEYNPGNLYVAGAAGKVQRLVDPSAVPAQLSESDSLLLLSDPRLAALEFHRNIYSARIGYGRRLGSYVALTGIYADDDEQSRALQSIMNRPVARFVERIDSVGDLIGLDTIVEPNHVVGTQRNYGFGGVGRLQREELGLTLDGEFNLSYFDDDAVRGGQMLIPRPQALPEFLKSDSMLIDFNYALRADWKLPGEETGTLNAGIRYVGGGYHSVGVAGLRTDVLRADARYRALMLDRRIRFAASYSFEEAGYKDSSNTSKIGALGASLDLRFTNLPAVSLSWQRHDQFLETGKRDTLQHRTTENGIEQLAATISWLRQWSEMRWSLFASAMMRNGTSKGSDTRSLPDSAGVFRTRTAQIDNRLSFGPALTFGVLASYTGTANHPLSIGQDSSGAERIETLTEEADIYSIDISALLEPFSILHVTLGAVASYQQEIPQPAVLGGYISSQLELGDFGSIALRFDYRESAVPDLKSTFPVERVGRVVTTLRF